MITDLEFKPRTIFQAIKLVELGIPVSRVGRRFEVPHYRVRFWVRRYQNLSVEAITREVQLHRPGRPKKEK